MPGLKDCETAKTTKLPKKEAKNCNECVLSGQGKHQKSTAFVGRGCGLLKLAKSKIKKLLNEVKQTKNKPVVKQQQF